MMYCGKNCQKSDFSRHKIICDSLLFLSNKEKVENNASQKDIVYVSHLSPKQRNQVAKLVGEKCLIKCKLSEKSFEVLWDNGAQVSIISLQTLRDRFGKVDIREIKELLDGQEIDLRAANGTSVPYMGWTDLNFSLDCDKDLAQGSVTIPFLVTGSTLEHPIVGFNVISEIVSTWQGKSSITDSLKGCFVLAEPQKVDQLISLIQIIDQESLTPVKTSKFHKVIEASKAIIVPCRANIGFTNRKIPMLFLADTQHLPDSLQIQDFLIAVKPGNTVTFNLTVTNTSNHEIRLPGRNLIGHLEPVHSAIPYLAPDAEIEGTWIKL